jgi:hypothetical protein
MQHWYVHYRLPHAQCSAFAARVDVMLNTIAATTSVRGRLPRRDKDDAQYVTLMEQYDGIADPTAFAAELANAVRDSGMAGEVIAQQRVERFEDL